MELMDLLMVEQLMSHDWTHNAPTIQQILHWNPEKNLTSDVF